MKKFYIPYIVFCIILLTLFVVNTADISTKEQTYTIPDTENSNYQAEIEDIKEKNEDIYYTVKSSGNYLYLFDNNENLIKNLYIDVDNMREYDRDLFEKGIKIKTMDEVYQLIEDFSN